MANREAILAWVEALESGEYSRTEGVLHDKNGYCCLGVACDIYAKTTLTQLKWSDTLEQVNGSESYGSVHGYSFAGEGMILPPAVQSWLGLDEQNPSVRENGYNQCLAEMNDEGVEFSKLAELIRETYLS